MPNFDFFNYAGLHRPIKLYTTPRTYIRDIVITTDYEEAKGIVRYAVDLAREKACEDVSVKVTILDEDGKERAAGEGAEGRLEFDEVQLWEPLQAYLYTLKVELVKQGRTVDVYEEPFGVRTVEVKDGKFYINRKPFYFKGFGKHEDAPIHGRGFAEAVNVMDFNLMKRWRPMNCGDAGRRSRTSDTKGAVRIGHHKVLGGLCRPVIFLRVVYDDN